MRHGSESARVVLVVEDDRESLEATADVLKSRGYAVVGVASGLEAVSYLQKHAPPCLILLDLMLPMMDGWEFRKKQMEHPGLALIPVVLLSGERALPEWAAALLVADCLQKPVTVERLIAAVTKHCGHPTAP